MEIDVEPLIGEFSVVNSTIYKVSFKGQAIGNSPAVMMIFLTRFDHQD